MVRQIVKDRRYQRLISSGLPEEACADGVPEMKDRLKSLFHPFLFPGRRGGLIKGE